VKCKKEKVNWNHIKKASNFFRGFFLGRWFNPNFAVGIVMKGKKAIKTSV
jgi:hypothetical protein